MKAPKPIADPANSQARVNEWMAFTDKLWQYQWLQKRDEVLSETVRQCWYDLSQGVLDIVVKLFVLAQLRAIATRTERITPQLLKQVYDDELRPVHPMLAALRSGDPELIAKYSDLIVPDIDKRILELSAKIDAVQFASNSELRRYGNNEQAIRLHNLLVGMDCSSDLIGPLIERAFSSYPNLSVRDLIPIVLEWYSTGKQAPSVLKNKIIKIKAKDWHTLDSEDLRFKFSQCGKTQLVYHELKRSELVFDVLSWMKKVG